MKIILEGCDGTGKTTLAKILANKYELDICHCTQYDASDFDFYKQTLRKDNVVWDRHTLGELIYPKVFGRRQQISQEDARILVHYAREEDVRLFVLTCDREELHNRIAKRENEHDLIRNNLTKIDDDFKIYAVSFDIPIIDTSKMTLSEIFKLVETPQINKGGFIHG